MFVQVLVPSQELGIIGHGQNLCASAGLSCPHIQDLSMGVTVILYNLWGNHSTLKMILLLLSNETKSKVHEHLFNLFQHGPEIFIANLFLPFLPRYTYLNSLVGH